MSNAYVYQGVYPIGDTEPLNMPVADLDSAVGWYERNMGFREKSRKSEPVPTVIIGRDDAEMGLAVNGGDPGQASCYLAVSDVHAAMSDLQEKGLRIGNHRIDDHNGKKYEVFFVKDEDGLCYCIGQEVKNEG